MTDMTATPHKGNAGPAPDRIALLHSLAFTAVRLSVTQLGAFTARLGEALSKAADEADSPDEVSLLRHAADHLEGRRATFHRLASECLQQELLQAVEAAAAHAASGVASGAMDLSLITFDAMERKVLIDNLSQAIDARDADLLAVLGMRVANWLQMEELGAAQNPFRSEVFLRAISEAWAKFDLQGAAHHLVLRQLRPEVFLRLGQVWQALNQELVVRKVLPEAEEKYRHRKTLPESIPAPSHIDTLRQWLAPEGTLHVIDARATQLLDKAFDDLQGQERIPPAIRALLTCLQPAISRVALADTDFFFHTRHPARRLLEAVIKAGLGCAPEDGEDDPLFQSIERITAPLLVEGEVPHRLFVTATGELDELLEQEDRRLGEKLAAASAEAIKQENISRAQRLAEEDVSARLESGDVPRFLEIFLQTQWKRVLAFAHGIGDSRPEALPAVLKAMDDLIRSMQPKYTPEARKDMIDSLPALLNVLNAWLNVVKWEGQERDGFFVTLAEQHAAALRAPAELSARAQLEHRMDVMQKASEHELGKRIQEQQEAAMADYMRLIDALAPGRWAEFVRNDGSRINCRLVWISPGRGRMIFTARQGQLLFPLADDALGQALRAERVELIPTDEMIGQALTSALRSLGVD